MPDTAKNTRELFLDVIEFNTAPRTLNWEFGYWGGTEPYQPLDAALQVIQEDESMQKADILFMTDGEFSDPPDEFLRGLNKIRKEIGVSLVSLVLFTTNQQCELFSDRVVTAMRLDDRGKVRMAFEDVFRRW